MNSLKSLLLKRDVKKNEADMMEELKKRSRQEYLKKRERAETAF